MSSLFLVHCSETRLGGILLSAAEVGSTRAGSTRDTVARRRDFRVPVAPRKATAVSGLTRQALLLTRVAAAFCVQTIQQQRLGIYCFD